MDPEPKDLAPDLEADAAPAPAGSANPHDALKELAKKDLPTLKHLIAAKKAYEANGGFDKESTFNLQVAISRLNATNPDAAKAFGTADWEPNTVELAKFFDNVGKDGLGQYLGIDGEDGIPQGPSDDVPLNPPEDDPLSTDDATDRNTPDPFPGEGDDEPDPLDGEDEPDPLNNEKGEFPESVKGVARLASLKESSTPLGWVSIRVRGNDGEAEEFEAAANELNRSPRYVAITSAGFQTGGGTVEYEYECEDDTLLKEFLRELSAIAQRLKIYAGRHVMNHKAMGRLEKSELFSSMLTRLAEKYNVGDGVTTKTQATKFLKLRDWSRDNGESWWKYWRSLRTGYDVSLSDIAKYAVLLKKGVIDRRGRPLSDEDKAIAEEVKKEFLDESKVSEDVQDGTAVPITVSVDGTDHMTVWQVPDARQLLDNPPEAAREYLFSVGQEVESAGHFNYEDEASLDDVGDLAGDADVHFDNSGNADFATAWEELVKQVREYLGEEPTGDTISSTNSSNKLQNENMKPDPKTIQRVTEAAGKTKTATELAAALCEDMNFKEGQDVFIAHSIGRAALKGKFVGLSNNYAKVKDAQGTIHTVLPHFIFPCH